MKRMSGAVILWFIFVATHAYMYKLYANFPSYKITYVCVCIFLLQHYIHYMYDIVYFWGNVIVYIWRCN